MTTQIESVETSDAALPAPPPAESEPPEEDESSVGDRPGPHKAPPVSISRDHLRRILESLIFVSDRPITERQLARVARAKLAEVQSLLPEMVEEWRGRGVALVEVAGGYQFRSAAANAPFVRAFVAKKPVRMSRAQLEALSIVAYRQPVTRPEVDEIRGVDSGAALKMLAERGLVRVLGRKDEPGRPLLYGTTEDFLEFFGLNSLEDLPTLKEFTELSEENRALFERTTGEPLDLHKAQQEAEAAEAEAQSEEFEAEEESESDEEESGPRAEADESAGAADADYEEDDDDESADDEDDDESADDEDDDESADDEDDDDEDEDDDDDDEDE